MRKCHFTEDKKVVIKNLDHMAMVEDRKKEMNKMGGKLWENVVMKTIKQ